MLKIIGRTLFVALWLGFAAFCIVLIVIPLVFTGMLRWGFDPTETFGWWVQFFEQAQVLGMKLFLPVWIFFVGGCFGSFLNVVAWRVPRGKSILGSSHCPNCDVQLKFPTTNVPILGWLKNGGRCGSCQWPIPVRYFVAELVLGATFVLLFQIQAASGGFTIPFRELSKLHLDPIIPETDLLVMLGYHLTLVSLILTFTICAWDKFTAPVRVLLVGVLILIGFQPFGLSPGIVDFQFGATSSENSGRFLKLLASLLLVGLALGWQAVLSVSVISCFIRAVTKVQFTAAIFCGTVLHLCWWRFQLVCWWPGPKSGPWQLAWGIFLVVVLALIFRFTMTLSLPLNKSEENFQNNESLPTPDHNVE